MRKILILPILFSLLLFGCGKHHHYPAPLLVADSLCETASSQALSWLDSIAPQMETRSEPERMYYRLLRIKATDKAYIDHTSDSLILPLVDYYEHGGDPSLLPTAYYYAGRTYMDLGDAPQAMDYLQRALDAYNPDSTNARQRGFCHTQMGRLCISQDLNEEAFKQYILARHCFEEIGDTPRTIYALSDISSAYNFLNEREKALETLKEAYRLTAHSGHKSMQPNVCNQLARTYHHLSQPDSARKYIQLALRNLTPDTRDATYNIACYIYSEAEPQDSLLYCARKILETGNGGNICYAHRRLAEHYARNGNQAQAMAHYRIWAEMDDSINDANSAKTVAKMQAMYNYQLREKENIRLKEAMTKKHLIIVILFSACLFLAMAVFFLTTYNRKKREALRLKAEKYMKLVEEYHQGRTRKEAKENSSFMDTHLYADLLQLLKDRRHIDDDQWQSFYEVFQLHYPDFHSNLSALAKMSRTNYNLCMLIKIGFKPEEIAILTAKSRDAIYSMRKRLYKKAFGKKGNGEDWDAVIRSI